LLLLAGDGGIWGELLKGTRTDGGWGATEGGAE